MRKYVKELAAICLIFLLTACASRESNNGNIAPEPGVDNATTTSMTFGELERTSSTGNVSASAEIKKILLEVSQDEQIKTLAVDLEQGEVYANKKVKRIYREEPTAFLTQEQTETIRKVLDEYGVLTWESSYGQNSEGMEDGSSWLLVIEGGGSVERYGGRGSNWQEITPPGFDEFESALLNSCGVEY